MKEDVLAVLLGLAALDPIGTKVGEGAGLRDKGLQVLHDRPQIRDQLDASLHVIAEKLGSSRQDVSGMLNVAIPELVEKICVAVADWESQKLRRAGGGIV